MDPIVLCMSLKRPYLPFFWLTPKDSPFLEHNFFLKEFEKKIHIHNLRGNVSFYSISIFIVFEIGKKIVFVTKEPLFLCDTSQAPKDPKIKDAST